MRSGGWGNAESNDSKSQLARALGSLSSVLLLNRRAGDALVAAQEALSLDPAALWVETNRAHALLFLGRFEEAKAVYVVDSFGALHREQVDFMMEKYMQYCKPKKVEVGMHAQNNLQCKRIQFAILP